MTRSGEDGHVLTDEQARRLAELRIFFGHQSVGQNIVEGVEEIIRDNPRVNLRLINSANPHEIEGPAFIEAKIGANRDTLSKDEAFATILSKGMGEQGGIAMYKYCWVDIDAATDVRSLFRTYHNLISDLKSQYGRLRIVPVTVPLTRVEPALKAFLRSALGRVTTRDVNARRQEFNELLREAYTPDGALFDLAAVESTRPNGSRTSYKWAGNTAYSLAPEYTSDGGHLNRSGRTAAACHLLRMLADLNTI
jgi:hypothetical protein